MSVAWLVAISMFASALAAMLFLRRDLGASALPRRVSHAPAVRDPAMRPTLRIPVLAGIDRQLGGLVGWAIALGAFGLFLGSLLPTMIRLAKEVPLIQLMVLRGGAGDLESGFVGAVWGSTALLVLSCYAIAQVAGWVADESDGRLEMALSAPVRRSRIVLERAATLFAGASLLVVVASVVIGGVTRAQGSLGGPRAIRRGVRAARPARARARGDRRGAHRLAPARRGMAARSGDRRELLHPA